MRRTRAPLSAAEAWARAAQQSGSFSRGGAVALGLLADRVLGEPPLGQAHPVAAYGRVMQEMELRLYRDSRSAGVVHAAAGVAIAAAAGWCLSSTAAATAVAVAGRGLAVAANEVRAALDDGDVDRARSLLPALAGREPGGLDEKELVRAVVESVAENTVDAVVAPALWAVVAGAPGALAYRGVNTLDAMVGHRSPRYLRFGWASARLDDLAAWVPARATALLVAVVRPGAAAGVWHAVRHDAPSHPSVNAGVAEAAFAAALGLRLGGTNVYEGRSELRPSLGSGRPPEPADIGRAVRLSADVTFALAGLLGFVAAANAAARRRAAA